MRLKISEPEIVFWLLARLRGVVLIYISLVTYLAEILSFRLSAPPYLDAARTLAAGQKPQCLGAWTRAYSFVALGGRRSQPQALRATSSGLTPPLAFDVTWQKGYLSATNFVVLLPCRSFVSAPIRRREVQPWRLFFRASFFAVGF